VNETKYGKYIITEPDVSPLPYGVRAEERTGYTRARGYINNRVLENAECFTGLIWVYEMPTPNPWVEEHTHPFDEVMFFIGNDPHNIEDLGGEVEIKLGDEIHTINKTAAVFVPKGLTHAPIWYKRVDRPHIFVGIGLGTGEYK